MDFDSLRAAARTRLDPTAWDYYQGVAGGDVDADHTAWQLFDLVPRVLQGLTDVDTTVTLNGTELATPVMVAATAAHGLAHPEGESATERAAAAAGALMVYSSSAAVEVTRFGAAATGPWWAQVYLMSDRARSDDYVARCVTAGAQALVLTVDLSGSLGDAPFRAAARTALTAVPGNFPGLSWAGMSAGIDPNLRPEHISQLAEASGLPVFVKGILHPADALAAVHAGAAGIIVSNHGRRQVDGVVATAMMLAEVVAAVDGQVPVLVDGGIRSGVDVLRALALGATAVGIGRPVLWALAADGAPGVARVLDYLTAELRQAMAAVGAPRLTDLRPGLLRARVR